MLKRCKAFTLVELLVVIGIIALLISILLPALSSARRAAGAVKCGAALREIGNSFQLYSQEYKGYAPASRIYIDSGSYNINGFDFTNAQAPFWFDFLEKYVTKSKVGWSAGADASASLQQLRSIFWACPAWDAYTNAAGPAGFNVTQPGYGMNGFPEYQPDFPPLGAELGEAGTYAQLVNTPRWTTAGMTTNRWYKLNKWNHPTERALVADCLFWFMEARPTPPNTPPNPWLVGEQNLANATTWTGPFAAYQTTFDYYRHGKYPSLNYLNTQFNAVGGKRAYEVLFADGHVSELTDQQSAYKVVRMRFPG